MKNLITQEIALQKESHPSQKKYIQRLQQMLDIHTYVQKDFVSTGMITSRTEFIKQSPLSPLHEKCTDVIVYLAGHYIQMLSDGKYLLNYTGEGRGHRSKDLNKIETIIYTQYI